MALSLDMVLQIFAFCFNCFKLKNVNVSAELSVISNFQFFLNTQLFSIGNLKPTTLRTIFILRNFTGALLNILAPKLTLSWSEISQNLTRNLVHLAKTWMLACNFVAFSRWRIMVTIQWNLTYLQKVIAWALCPVITRSCIKIILFKFITGSVVTSIISQFHKFRKKNRFTMHAFIHMNCRRSIRLKEEMNLNFNRKWTQYARNVRVFVCHNTILDNAMW